MKPKSIRLALASITLAFTATPAILNAAPIAAYEGLNFDDPVTAGLAPWDPGTLSTPQTAVQLYSSTGGVLLYSDVQESLGGTLDGGVTLYGSPVTIVLNRQDGFGTPFPADSLFTVNDSATWLLTPPIFQVNGNNRETTFADSDVEVIDGSLKVDGEDVLTGPSAATAGFIQTTTLGSALNALTTAPTGTAWTTAYVPRGTVSGGASLALGTSTASGTNAVSFGASTASGTNSVSFGSSVSSGTGAISSGSPSTSATGLYSFAMGLSADATGSQSIAIGSLTEAIGSGSMARGYNVHATGSYTTTTGANSYSAGLHSWANGNNSSSQADYSFANGLYTYAKTPHEAVFGRYNKQGTYTASTWNEEDALFRLGNGTEYSATSDALTTLKNGQTTLINKAWDAAYTTDPDTALDDPAATTDSGGEALVVRGHTRLKGKVTIEVPQGDISMGIFE